MYLFYEEDGGFKVATLIAENDASFQIDTASGKRAKIKAANVLLRFSSPSPADLLSQAQQIAQELDVRFLWECAPQEEFEAITLASEYFGHTPTAVERAALLIKLHECPIYFHKRGKGKYQAAPEQILQAALSAQEKKRVLAQRQADYTQAIVDGHLPEEIRAQAANLLFRPDKNSIEWKALNGACERLQTKPEQILLKHGAFEHALTILKHRFLAEYFPRGIELPEVSVPTLVRELPVADVVAYSIDDTTTTEIDDALSVTQLADGRLQIGVHIAAPGLAVSRDSPLDVVARERMSTVYTPGQKIQMQPNSVVQAFSLDAGHARPSLSLYVTTLAGDWQILSIHTRIEQLTVRENLRHPLLEEHVTEAALNDPNAPLPYGETLRPLWHLALALGAEREQVRGKPELHSRVEFNFYVEGEPDNPNQAKVNIVPRKRGAPLDRLVAEYMILANKIWGGVLKQSGLPGIYRSQQAGRVRMSTHAQPHESIGVAQYGWFTSPLRRYIDLVNQWQLIAAVDHGISAPLAAPFKPKDAQLFAIISAFETRYTAYNEFQHQMEQFWCIRWLIQNQVRRLDALVLREDLARLSPLPLVVKVPGMPALNRGDRILLDIVELDELGLEVGCKFVAQIDNDGTLFSDAI